MNSKTLRASVTLLTLVSAFSPSPKAFGATSTTTLGITKFAVDALTDLVFLDLPAKGKKVEAGKPFGSIESVKAVSDLISPVSGEVVEVNDPLAQKPEGLSADPWKQGWMLKVKVAGTPGGLLDAAAYDKQSVAH